jgi:hypothetical protein
MMPTITISGTLITLSQKPLAPASPTDPRRKSLDGCFDNLAAASSRPGLPRDPRLQLRPTGRFVNRSATAQRPCRIFERGYLPMAQVRGAGACRIGSSMREAPRPRGRHGRARHSLSALPSFGRTSNRRRHPRSACKAPSASFADFSPAAAIFLS